MSLYGAMFSGVSALNAQSQALGMISDNISNVNTVGYKTTNAAFSSLVTRSTANFHAPGGVRSSPISAIDRQGLLQSSASPTDLAISGDGFFVVGGKQVMTASDGRTYTRAGQFSTDQNGYLKTPAGQFLQGWATDNTGTPTASNTSILSGLESVRVSNAAGNAVATSSITMAAVLPANATLGQTHATSVEVFDSLGAAHNVTFTWTKLVGLSWDLTAAANDGGVVTFSGGGSPVTTIFNTDGTPATFDGLTAEPTMTITGWSSGAANSVIALEMGTAGALGVAKADGLVMSGSSFTVGSMNQNGVQFGNFVGVDIDDLGIVSALFDNGQTLKIYKLPVATFPNPNGLEAKTGSAYGESAQSGGYILRSAGNVNAGKIISSALEASTSDLANEFTNMIITQRAYSAATKTITTADQMLEELLRIR